MLREKINKKRIGSHIHELLKSWNSKDNDIDEIDLMKVAHSSINKGYYENKPIQRVIFYLRSKGCEWSMSKNGGCYMCGHYFGTTKGKELPKNAFFNQFYEEYKKYDFKNIPMVCIYNAGSILNNNEIPNEELFKILEIIKDNHYIKSVIIESRPEFINDNILSVLKYILKGKTIEIGIGLETADDSIRDLCINKGFSFKDYKNASEKLRSNNIHVLTYLTIKPLFLTIKESIRDVINNLILLENYTDVVSLEPISIQNGTLVQYMYKNGYYILPKGWMIKEIFQELNFKKIDFPYELRLGGFEFFPIPDIFIGNCEICNENLYKAIDCYNTTKNVDSILNLNCKCFNDYKEFLNKEEQDNNENDIEERISLTLAKMVLNENTKWRIN
ncbi:MAG TPA: radical SAM protein [Spirochaetota bacterium]|nr:radical SAM protein [Spirochaetota bacterium]